MQEQQKQLVERLKQAQNVLVTVSANPSVDQLSAAIGLTLVLNHLGKHGTAVYSGETPSTLEFLKPEDTLEKNTDSLRDFIIALDKSKADKLRYKVEDQVVRIFITPYKTSISEKDLDFSQGDFNVDVVVALGVHEQQDLDVAITANGRILHDATLASISLEAGGTLGSINWVDTSASSLSELVVNLADELDKKVIDSQIATALLTGIVSSTARFSNDRTTPKTMSASAALMAAGANQQLIATELETVPEAPVEPEIPEEKDDKGTEAETPTEPEPAKPVREPGTLEIEHEDEEEKPESNPEPTVEALPEESPHPQVDVDEDGRLTTLDKNPAPETSPDGVAPEIDKTEVSHERLTEPPQVDNGSLTANTSPEGLDPPAEELTLPPVGTPILSHNESVLSSPAAPPAAPAAAWAPPPLEPDETLTEIEQAVGSPHLQSDGGQSQTNPMANLDGARSAVDAAYNHSDDPLAPIAALNAQPLGEELHSAMPQPVTNTGFSEPTPGNTPADDALDMPLPGAAFGGQPAQSPFPAIQPPPPSSFPGAPGQSNNPSAPPPVPPPMLPPLQ